MAIVINGSGTVTGISVGGLPDGIVDAGTLATNSVDSAELIDGAVDDSHMAAMAASKLTGALPAISGASLTGITTGKILQVVSANSTTATYPTTSWTHITSAMATITPSATSSKIFYIFTGGGLISGSSGDCGLQLTRDATVINQYARYLYSSQADWVPANLSFMHVDSPNTTSAVTYRLYGKESNSVSWEINDTVGSTTAVGSGVVLMEIAG